MDICVKKVLDLDLFQPWIFLSCDCVSFWDMSYFMYNGQKGGISMRGIPRSLNLLKLYTFYKNRF